MSEQASSLHVEFFSEPVENPAKTRLEGRPIFEEQEFVKIKFPGDNKRIHVAPANEGFRRDPATNGWVTYAEEYPRHYELFKSGQAQTVAGTPLSELTFLTESKRAELRALNIQTAEQLAGLDGSFLARLGMGGRALKDQATAYLAHATETALEARLAGENAALREQMEALQKQMADIMQGKAAASVATVEPSGSPFSTWEDEDIKVFINDRQGSRPKGNPSHETLVRMADDIIAKEAADAEAA
tara:strand:+ start:179 stop:910 length:732 start_codon:yes stop_codon:yes gene_type:complete